MNKNFVKAGSFLFAIALSGAALADENVAQANIAAIYQPFVVTADTGAAPAGGVSLLNGPVLEWLDPSRSVSTTVAAEEEVAVAKAGNVAQEDIHNFYTAYSAN